MPCADPRQVGACRWRRRSARCRRGRSRWRTRPAGSTSAPPRPSARLVAVEADQDVERQREDFQRQEDRHEVAGDGHARPCPRSPAGPGHSRRPRAVVKSPTRSIDSRMRQAAAIRMADAGEAAQAVGQRHRLEVGRGRAGSADDRGQRAQHADQAEPAQDALVWRSGRSASGSSSAATTRTISGEMTGRLSVGKVISAHFNVRGRVRPCD